uniref:Uncharacterized protein n=1 Tax=Myoviridae sp. ctJ2i1 TaxID=2825079 RepID=A0A8S5V1V7_9CAUD|nr:MAG TPA: hypothetical protein [Myoviridae sp. ctJ2i1]
MSSFLNKSIPITRHGMKIKSPLAHTCKRYQH